MEEKGSRKRTFAPNNIALHLYLECSRTNIVALSLIVIILKHWSQHHKDRDQNISVAQNFFTKYLTGRVNDKKGIMSIQLTYEVDTATE